MKISDSKSSFYKDVQLSSKLLTVCFFTESLWKSLIELIKPAGRNG